MDYMLDREALRTGEVLYDGCQEQPVDMDISLPDYCPDIQRILKCQVYPRITSRNVTGDRLELEGVYTVKVFYLDADGCAIRCCENSAPFFAAIGLKQPADGAQVHACVRVEYVNCRAASPRRLDVHGAFSLCARVVCQGDCEVIKCIRGCGVEQQTAVMPYSRAAGFCAQGFSIDEVLELPSGKPPAETVLRSDAIVNVQDFKIVANKLMVKGDVFLRMLYTSTMDDAMLESMEYSVPFSQMLDCDGVDDTCQCSVELTVQNVDIQIKNDYSGDKIFFDTQMRVFATATAFTNSEATVVTEAYSKEYEMDVSYRQKTMENLVEIINDTAMQKNNFQIDDTGITKVIDIWSEMCTATAGTDGEQVAYRGKFNICMLAMGSNGKPFYFERVVEFEHARPWSKAKDTRCVVSASVAGIGYRITGSGIETRTELRLSASMFQQSTCKIIDQATPDETRPRTRDRSAALSLYFAEKGERLWDIAKEYCTSMASIQSENDLSCTAMENRGMLLIPMS